MKKTKDGHSSFFVDESGDPTFYDARGNLIVGAGSSPILILGFIETQTPRVLRQAVLDLQRQIINDDYLRSIPSVRKTATAFHAKDDTPEVRYLFYKLIKQLEFKTHFIVARKIEKVFRNSFEANENKFYDHLAAKLFKNVLHRHSHNHVYFAERGSRTRQKPLETAIRQAKEWFDEKTQNDNLSSIHDVQAQSPKGEPCLSVIDYMNWAVYRAYTKGEMRYFNFVSDKVSLLVDLYDSKPCRHNYYGRKNVFDICKVTPL
ncbi:MAG: DUF3800 domain-containing protein [Pyrinomonadaceae bacterium MAG19_C2-C3]|nr:DUF3800 domain-containing protein [Pyrinomonadaceae bacterium MAG19_C2-C3]